MRLFYWLFNIRPATWTRGGQWRIEFLSLPRHDFALLAAAVVGIVVWLVIWVYRRETVGSGGLTRWGLACLRLLLLATATVMLLEPVLIFRQTEYVPSNLIILADDSTSMDLADAYADDAVADAVAGAMKLPGGRDELRKLSRRQLSDVALNKPLLTALAAGGDRIVRRHPFATRLSPTTGPTTNPVGDAIERSGTAIGAAVRQAIAEYQGQPIAGVLVVTDGQSNTGEPPVKAAEFAAAEGVPVVSLAVGTTQGPRSVRISKLDVSPVVFVRDPSPIHVLVESRGMPHQQATVVLERSRGGGPWEEIGRQSVALEEAGRVQTVDFDFHEDRPVKEQMRARLEDAGAELKADDHTAVADVRAINQKIKVLFIAGETFPEVEFIRAMLLRDKGISASTWNQTADTDYEQPGDPPIRRLPETPEELNDYDCIILYDPDPSLWPANYSQLLTDFVAKEGGGLVFVAGERNTKDVFDRPDDPALAWLNLLPVVVDPGLYHTDVSVKLSSESPWKFDVTAEGKTDSIFQFADRPDDNDTILKNLPGMYWHFPVTQAKPGATVLARHGDPRMRNEHGQHVLLSTQLVGPGRTFFCSFDSTYRWRYLDDRYFDSFWAHLVDRAGRSKQLGGRYPYSLSTDRDTYRPGGTINLVARFDNPADRDAGLTSLHGDVTVGEDQPIDITLNPRPGDPNVFEANIPADKAGAHHVRVWAGDTDVKTLGRVATLSVPVELPDLEYDNPSVDLATLHAVATASGGKVYTLTDAAQIPAAFKIHKIARTLEDRQEVWDAPALFGLVVALIVAEWLLRKKAQLV